MRFEYIARMGAVGAGFRPDPVACDRRIYRLEADATADHAATT